LPSVVTITAGNGSNDTTGSGEIIRSDGNILTNNHVVAPAAPGGRVIVVFSNGTSHAATITGLDPATDLAVIKVDQSSLPVISFGSSSSVRIGQPVVALGAPLGLSNTVTTGIVSALGRTIQVPLADGNTATLLAAIQTDAAINPGNSGGALTDCSGHLIGVPTANATVTTSTGQTSTGNVGVNFAIPVDLAKLVSDEIIATGTVTHSYVGADVTQNPPTSAAEGGASEGLLVTSVAPGGPSASAGLQEGDVITKIDGQPATNANQLALLTLTKKPGETVALDYVRGGKSAHATVTLGTPPM
jgi:putative serine protease PepD